MQRYVLRNSVSHPNSRDSVKKRVLNTPPVENSAFLALTVGRFRAVFPLIVVLTNVARNRTS
jgi:hypothetical protein